MTSTVRSGYSCKGLKKFSDQRVKAQSIKSVQANIAETAKKNTVNYTEHLNSMLNWGNINRIIFTANHTEDLNSMLNLRNIKYR
jgi:hypothetical protein